MKPTGTPSNFLIAYGANSGLPVLVAHHVGGQEAELRPLELAEHAAPRRVELRLGVAAALLHALELGRALVELVVADRVEVEADLVHRLDRGLVVEQRRHERRCADQVAGGDDEAVAVPRLELPDVLGEVGGAAGRHRASRRDRRDVRSSPILFMASIVGSSWNSADISGEAPIRSPAETTRLLRLPASSCRTCSAKYAAPPAGIAVAPWRRRDEPAAARRRLQVAVEVVEAQQLHVHGLEPLGPRAVVLAVLACRVPRRRPGSTSSAAERHKRRRMVFRIGATYPPTRDIVGVFM